MSRARRPRTRTSGVEAAIRKAQEDGAFDDLPGHGRPLENLDEVYDPAWWAKSLVQREGVSVLPPALELKRRVEQTLATLSTLPSERQVRERLAALDAEIARTNSGVTSGPATSVPRLDVEAEVARWKATRARS